MTTQNTARVPDPRQTAFDRAYAGIRWVSIGERNRIIADAKRKYVQAVRAQQAAERARNRRR